MRSLLPSAVLLLAAGCVQAPRTPPPAPAPTIAAPAPAPAPVPLSGDWQDWPLTPGDWSYRAEAGGSASRFGPTGAAPRLVLRCDRARGMALEIATPVAIPVTVRTSSATRALPVAAIDAVRAGATLAPRDPLLDAMVFSRGRIAFQQPGRAPVVVPTWAEIARVIEDCRR